MANQKELDVKTTIFVGNLYYKTKDEELRAFFKECGEVVSVRIIRDPQTHLGKGFAYVRFANKAGYNQGLSKNKAEFMQRELRIKKAIEVQEENKKKSIIDKDKRDKEFRVNKDYTPMDQETLKEHKAENKKMAEFSHKRQMVDEMTDDRAEEIYKTVAKIPTNMIRGQMKKIKKEGVVSKLILVNRS